MDGLYWTTLLKWMIWGYHYFWKHPNLPGRFQHSPSILRIKKTLDRICLQHLLQALMRIHVGNNQELAEKKHLGQKCQHLQNLVQTKIPQTHGFFLRISHVLSLDMFSF